MARINVAVDVFVDREMGLAAPTGKYDYELEERDRHADRPAYAARKIRPDKKAIAHFDAMPRPKKPPCAAR